MPGITKRDLVALHAHVREFERVGVRAPQRPGRWVWWGASRSGARRPAPTGLAGSRGRQTAAPAEDTTSLLDACG
jgi:hypothetical protein